uniref:ETS domain-containing protein n=1 Tax=Monodon monoceros TaxID=40151 RepID=A0A8C6F3P0_MONMO
MHEALTPSPRLSSDHPPRGHHTIWSRHGRSSERRGRPGSRLPAAPRVDSGLQTPELTVGRPGSHHGQFQLVLPPPSSNTRLPNSPFPSFSGSALSTSRLSWQVHVTATDVAAEPLEDFKGRNYAPRDPEAASKVASFIAVNNAITLWQFLLQLLKEPQNDHMICWTSNDGEFKHLQAEELNMNYDKHSQSLRYYYMKNIIENVRGQKFVYKFVSHPEILNTTEALRISEVSSERSIDEENGGKKKPPQPGAKTPSCSDYRHSGLYSSFTLKSLNSSNRKLFKSIKVENPAEKFAEKKIPSVIKFVTPSKKPPAETLAAVNSTDPSISPSSKETIQALESLYSPKLPSLETPTSASSTTAAFTTTPPISSVCRFQEPPRTPSLPLSSNPDMDPDMDADMDADRELVASQPMEIPDNLSLESKDQDSALPEKDKIIHQGPRNPKG